MSYRRKGSYVERDIASIFRRAGFFAKTNVKIKGYEVDVLIKVKNSFYIVECKQYENSYLNIKNILHQWDSKNKIINAKGVIVVIIGQDIEEEEYELAEKLGIILFSERDIERFKEMSDEELKKRIDKLLNFNEEEVIKEIKEEIREIDEEIEKRKIFRKFALSFIILFISFLTFTLGFFNHPMVNKTLEKWGFSFLIFLVFLGVLLIFALKKEYSLMQSLKNLDNQKKELEEYLKNPRKYYKKKEFEEESKEDSFDDEYEDYDEDDY